MRFGVTKQQIIHILKVAGYVAVSSVIGAFIAITTEQPEVFGIATPVINVLLVTLRQVLKKPEEA